MNPPNRYLSCARAFLRLDGQIVDRAWHTEVIPQSRRWQWNRIRAGLKLTAGDHVLEFVHRESGVKLDRIIVTADATFTPAEPVASP